jgi:Tol biopolymer transport system component
MLADGIHELSLDGKRDVLIPNSSSTATTVSTVSWSADGRHLVYTKPSETRVDRNRYAAQDLYTFDVVGNCTRLLTRSGADTFHSPSLSPDGSRLSYIRRVNSMVSEPATLEIARTDGSDVRRVASGLQLLGGTWAPDGSDRLAFGQDGGLRVDQRGQVTVVDDARAGAEYQSWSPDSSHLVYTFSVNQGVWVAAADGSGVRNLSPAGTRQPAGIYWSRWAPDGRSIVYGHGKELWVVGTDGSNRRRIAEDVGFSGGWFTPSGTEVVYTGPGGVHVVAVDGQAAPRLLKANATALAVFRRN